MKENEIKKALEKWIKALKDDYKRLQLLDAPMDCFEESHTDNIRKLSNALDLINRLQTKLSEALKCKATLRTNFMDARKEISRLKAENERLQEENLILSQKRANMYEILEANEKGRIRGFKEFANGLIEKAFSDGKYEYRFYVENYLKEVVGEDKTPSAENNFLLNRFMKKE